MLVVLITPSGYELAVVLPTDESTRKRVIGIDYDVVADEEDIPTYEEVTARGMEIKDWMRHTVWSSVDKLRLSLDTTCGEEVRFFVCLSI